MSENLIEEQILSLIEVSTQLVELLKAEKDAQRELAEKEALPIRMELVRTVTEIYRHLLAILDHIAQRDKEGVEAAVREHVTYIQERLSLLIESGS